MLKSDFKLIRYADDFVILCKTNEEAENSYNKAKLFLKNRLHLELHERLEQETKTRITNFSQGFDFLGISFNHTKICPNLKTRKNFKQRVSEILDYRKCNNLIDTLFKLRNTIKGWANSNNFCHKENLKRNMRDTTMIKIFDSLEGHIQVKLFKLLERSEFLPKGKRWRGIHLKKLSIPCMSDFLLRRQLADFKKRKKVKR